jgi:N-succinyldiaminopimelate aminotransferase
MFARLYERLATFKGDVISLQIGDTHLLPPEAGRLCAQAWSDISARELYAYAPPAGWGPLLDAITDKVARRNRIPIEPGGVQVTCGATHALSCAVGALLDPGDELILLTPHWPLVKGIAQTRSVVPVEVPFSPLLAADPGLDVVALIEQSITPRTAAIYVSSPNNPDGLVMDERTLRGVAEVAERHGLWILSDEVYEDYVYDGAQHLSIASLPGAERRTVTVFSFSKSYAQAGLRAGYAVGPTAAMAAVRKMANHSVYNVPQGLQRAALGALTGGDAFLADARVRYAAVRDQARAALRVPCTMPRGATYLFLDLQAYCESLRDGDRRAAPRGCMPVLERVAEAGVLLAPGAAFGAAYDGWARLCFTAATPERVLDGIARINRVCGVG